MVLSSFKEGTGATVYKSLGDFPVRHEDVAVLKERGVWRMFSRQRRGRHKSTP